MLRRLALAATVGCIALAAQAAPQQEGPGFYQAAPAAGASTPAAEPAAPKPPLPPSSPAQPPADVNAGPTAPAPAPADTAGLCRKDARIFAFTDGAWWPARAQHLEQGGCLVRYDGYEAEEDEILALDALKAWSANGPGQAYGACRVGDKVFAYAEDAWWPAKIISIKSNGCRVRYDGYGAEDDDILPASKLRRP